LKKYPCVFMRGGTSKAVFFQEKNLPADKNEWPEIFMKVMGTPDIKQIDGMGGGVSSTSKIAVISSSTQHGADVDYHFFQVDIVIPNVDNSANCGNISSAVGPYVVDEGLVAVTEPETVVNIHNVNTGKIIEEHVPVKDGHAQVDGNTTIDGVPGSGAPIQVLFIDPGGSKTGKLFPTGKKREILEISGNTMRATIIDCSNPVLIITARDLGISGAELTELNDNKAVMARIEAARGLAAEKLGFVSDRRDAATQSTSIPKVCIISPPQDYMNMGGELVSASTMDFCARAISVGCLHKAIPLTVAIAAGSASRIPGTLIHDMIQPKPDSDIVRIGHSSGVIQIRAVVEGDRVIKAGAVRTARRIMDGFVYIR
jgi:2-methylaconitate cis-trans-isomerase PrpF